MKPTFKQFLTELFNQPYQWEWARALPDEQYQATFQTENETPFEVNFGPLSFPRELRQQGDPKVVWAIVFGVTQATKSADFDKKLGEFNASKILATIVDIIKSFVKQQDPHIIMFSGTKGEGNDLARASVYKKMVDRELPSNYEVEVTDAASSVEFIIRKTQ